MELQDVHRLTKIINKSIKILCRELEKEFPGITDLIYDGEKATFEERMRMGLSLELMRADIFK